MFEKIMRKIQIFFIWVIVAIMVCFVAVAEIASVRYLAQYYCHYCEDNISGILQFDTEERLVYKTCELCGSRYESFSPKSITDIGTTEVDCEGNYYKIELWTYMFSGWTMQQRVYFAQNTGEGRHEHTRIIQEAIPNTCTTDGRMAEIYCDDCHKTIQEATVIPAAHDTYEIGRIEPTCTSEGHSGHIYCHHCDYEDAVGYTIPMIEHDTYIKGYVPATCASTGYTGDTKCHDCDYIVRGELIRLTEHDFRLIASGIEPTCKTTGRSPRVVCYDCGYEEGGDFLTQVDHKYHRPSIFSKEECIWCGETKY